MPVTDLIDCKKCGNQVSKAARCCPKCGHPIGKIGWILENKILLLVTSLLGVNGLWFVNFFKQETVPVSGKGEVQQSKPKDDKTPKEKTGKPKDVKTTSCSDCKGTQVCTLCKGKPSSPCPHCQNSGKPGYRACEKCEGNGKLTCPACKGRGQRSGDDKPCDRCKGDGKLLCNKCDGKSIMMCTKCFGRGTVHCIKCGGSGKCIACSVK